MKSGLLRKPLWYIAKISEELGNNQNAKEIELFREFRSFAENQSISISQLYNTS